MQESFDWRKALEECPHGCTVVVPEGRWNNNYLPEMPLHRLYVRPEKGCTLRLINGYVVVTRDREASS